MTLETLSQTRERLALHGFGDDLMADHGQLRSAGSDQMHDIGDVVAAETIRYEGSSNPSDEAIVIAVSTRHGEPVGTFTVPYGTEPTAEQADILERLHGPQLAVDAPAHTDHSHVAAIFSGRDQATAAVDDLRSLGLGSEHLGVAVRSENHHVFEPVTDTSMTGALVETVAAGGVIGYLAGLAIFAAAVPALGVGGVFAAAGSVAYGGAMLGGYVSVGSERADFDPQHAIDRVNLAPHEVLVVACGHQHRGAVRAALQRHGGRLTPID